MKLLAALFGIIDKLLAAWAESRWKEQGRRETIKEMNDALNAEIEKADNAVAAPDPERDERLRSRFGRPAPGE